MARVKLEWAATLEGEGRAAWAREPFLQARAVGTA